MKYNINELEKKLLQCRKKKIEEVDINEVDNLAKINIDRKKKGNERILDFINKTINPYIFKIDGKIVKIEFSSKRENENTLSAEDCLTGVIAKIYE